MNSRVAWQLGANTLALAIFVSAWFTSRDFPDSTRLFPTVVVLAGLVLVLVRFAQDYVERNRSGDGIEHSGMDLRADEQLTHLEAIRKASVHFTWIVGIIGASTLFGPLPVLPLFIVCHLRFSGGEQWKTAIGAALGFTVFLLVVFEVLLNTFWPEGLISWPQDMLLRGIEAVVDTWL